MRATQKSLPASYVATFEKFAIRAVSLSVDGHFANYVCPLDGAESLRCRQNWSG